MYLVLSLCSYFFSSLLCDWVTFVISLLRQFFIFVVGFISLGRYLRSS